MMILPRSEVVWSGSVKPEGLLAGQSDIPVRLVRRWTETAQKGQSFKPTPEYILEVASSKDAMGEPLWTIASLSRLPGSFFESHYPLPQVVPQESPS